MTKKSQNQSLFDLETPAKPQGPVECLGLTFENDEARREHFLGLLREGLEELHAKLGGVPFTTVEDAVERMKSVEKWPMGDDARLRELAERMRHAEKGKDLLQRWKDEVGFPHGAIEDILNLSDPPYYTACPNPFIADFIKRYGKPYDPNVPYSKEPFAADVSEGKNDPIYNAHSYHTKVPHKAIMRYILHYTEPGDVVFDGFCGTGMTGVAAQLCGDKKTVESLGYRVDDQGVIYQQETDENGKTIWKPFSKLGPRRAVLNDLSPAATFIAYNYNTPVDVQAFEREAKRILKEVEEECGWMYATLASEVASRGSRVESQEDDVAEEWAEKLRACKTADEIGKLLSSEHSILGMGPTWGQINYIVWSDVFVCPECTQEVVFWEAAVDKQAGKVHGEFPCPHCSARLTKRNMDRAWVTRYDKAIGQTIRQAKQVPVLINYSVGKKRYEKTPDAFDLALTEKIEKLDIPYWFPTDPIPEGDKTGEPLRIGITHVHHFYTKRNLWVLDSFAHKSQKQLVRALWVATACTEGLSALNRERPFGLPSKLSGTLYVSSMIREINALAFLRRKIEKYEARSLGPYTLMASQSSTLLDEPDLSVDYIFTDPPFGGNLMYSELNFLWEAWLKVFTNNKPEAIENKVQGKGLPEYQRLMTECFKEYYRVLKPGRWMTVEFHNSKNSVWTSIQEALQTAGFVIADVRTLDKKQGSFNQVTQAGAVKQDIIISCYKPNGGLEERFKLEAGTEEGVWDFVRTHLRQLPVFVSKDGKAEVIAERQNYLLFDRMVAFHVQRGVTVPLSAAEFYAGLARRFPERDGMYFLPEQVAEYDKKRMKVSEVLQLQLFVTDEASAIQWLKASLTRKPQTFQELHPQFLKEIGGWQKHEKPLELSELLEQNFLRYDGKGPIPAQIVSWMKQSSSLRELISSELRVTSDEPKYSELETRNPELLRAAKDRWYVPDPNKASDLEKLRERALLREFEEYRESSARRLKVFRLEAVRAGFKKAWQERDYATIIAVARKIPENVLQEDPKLLMWYDQALTRMGEA
jgi:DNA modification methylase